MLMMTGSAAAGLVWGWLLADRGFGDARRGARILAGTLLFTVETLAEGGSIPSVLVLGTAAAALVARLVWIHTLRVRAAALLRGSTS